jgi:predicted transcriptional regulator
MTRNESSDRELLLEVVKRAPMLVALREEALSPRELQERLDVSKSTAHRNATSLTDRGLLRKSDGEHTLTEFGQEVADVVSTFEADMATTVRLAPMLDAVSDTDSPCPIDAFADATVTSTDHGDPFGPLARFVSLVSETDSFRMADSHAIAPAYIDEIQGRVLDGLEAKVIERPEVAEDIMENYPRRCVRLCGSEHFTLKLLDDLPFGLVILDHRVGVGVRDSRTGTPRAFVDTDSDQARDWAETVFDSYWNEATRLDHFNPRELREVIKAQAE